MVIFSITEEVGKAPAHAWQQCWEERKGFAWLAAFSLPITSDVQGPPLEVAESGSPFSDSGLKGLKTLRITDTGNMVTVLEKG